MRKAFLLLAALACSSGGVDSTEAAKEAYLGLDESIDKAINLGFDGFNAAQSANIPTQQTTGDLSGTMQIGGQVDQGASANKTMRLQETLTGYSDTDGGIVYDTNTDAGLPELDMKLANIPNGTVDGTLVGTYGMSGALEGEATLNVAFSGALEPNDAGGVERKAGSTHITGTATSGSGSYAIDVTR
ncbi:MAG TPA: hypothetical protein VGH28_12925 [Polyangiaceae bacterium]|jgi:hypothetical protein